MSENIVTSTKHQYSDSCLLDTCSTRVVFTPMSVSPNVFHIVPTCQTPVARLSTRHCGTRSPPLSTKSIPVAHM
ncbi:hypothetical protein C0J52_25676 [Blattella germanica]|nr:hypothetical protein C0J52_25676 [Blattella germanica]